MAPVGGAARGELDQPQFFNPEGALTLRGVAGTRTAARVQFAQQFQATRPGPEPRRLGVEPKYDAYEAKTALLAGHIERQSNFIWQKKWTYTGGFELLATDDGARTPAMGSRARAPS